MTIDVYPVGALSAARFIWYACTRRSGTPFAVRRAAIVAELRIQARTIGRHIRNRQWHDLKNNFNGYLAEPTPFPPGMKRCGSGWTRRRALRSLQRHARRPGVTWDLTDATINDMLRSHR